MVKANDLIQKSRFHLSLQQQKIVLYLISQITPYDDDFKLYEFSITDFCKVCGIDFGNGKNYQNLKSAIKEIRDKSIWVTLDDGRETALAWIEKPYIEPRNGTIQIRLDADMKPFLLQLKSNFTQYELIYTLHFKSKYTIRLYELIKSIHFHELETYKRQYNLEELKKLLDSETYKTYQHFKDRVLNPAVEEINNYSDKELSYEPIRKGKRTVVGIEFTIKTKDILERLNILSDIESDMGASQMTFDDLAVDATSEETEDATE